MKRLQFSRQGSKVRRKWNPTGNILESYLTQQASTQWILFRYHLALVLSHYRKSNLAIYAHPNSIAPIHRLIPPTLVTGWNKR